MFANEKRKPQHFVLNKYYIDYYFPEHKLTVEIDERTHLDRNEDKDRKKEKEIKEELDCEFIRINLSKECFNINIEFDKIHNQIIESTKEPTKKALPDELSNKLLKLEFKSNNSMKNVVKKYCLHYKNEACKACKACLACKKHTNNIGSRKVTMTNK